MAKKKRRGATSKKRSTKRKPGKKRSAAKSAAAKKARQALGIRRAKAHAAAALLADFHGGKAPFKSGCGRPRGS